VERVGSRTTLKGVLVAGPSGVVLSSESLDIPLESVEALSAATRGVIPMPDGDSVPEVVGALSTTP
jgi:hypothetical protein